MWPITWQRDIRSRRTLSIIRMLVSGVAVGAIVGVATSANADTLGGWLICRVIPLCGDGLPSNKPVHEIRWLGNTPNDPSLKLNIPREYMTFYIKPTKKEPTEFITISTYLPELKPLNSRPRQQCPNSSIAGCEIRTGQGDDFDIRLKSDSLIGSYRLSSGIGREYWAKIYPSFKREADKLGFQHYVEHGGTGTCIRRDIVENDPTVRPELRQIAAGTAEKYICWPDGSEIFVSVGDASRPDTVIRCGALFESVKFGPKCVAEINYNSWLVQYMFPGSELNRWREFDAGTRELLRRLSSP